MARSVLIAVVSRRRDAAVELQKTLTEFGCLIRTRLGIHDAAGAVCSDGGLIILELVGEPAGQKRLAARLRTIGRMKVKLVPVDRG